MVAKTPENQDVSGNAPEAGDGIDNAEGRCGYKQEHAGASLRAQLVTLLPRLRRFAYSLTRDHDACNDLVQETCLRALSRAELWQEGTRLDSWLFRIAQNIWLDRKRAERTRGEKVDVDEIDGLAGADGRSVTENRLSLAEVTRGMALLKPDHQVVIGLVCVDGMSYKEAAEVLELPIGTVMSRLSRARLELFDRIEQGNKGASATKPGGRRG